MATHARRWSQSGCGVLCLIAVGAAHAQSVVTSDIIARANVTGSLGPVGGLPWIELQVRGVPGLAGHVAELQPPQLNARGMAAFFDTMQAGADPGDVPIHNAYRTRFGLLNGAAPGNHRAMTPQATASTQENDARPTQARGITSRLLDDGRVFSISSHEFGSPPSALYELTPTNAVNRLLDEDSRFDYPTGAGSSEQVEITSFFALDAHDAGGVVVGFGADPLFAPDPGDYDAVYRYSGVGDLADPESWIHIYSSYLTPPNRVDTTPPSGVSAIVPAIAVNAPGDVIIAISVQPPIGEASTGVVVSPALPGDQSATLGLPGDSAGVQGGVALTFSALGASFPQINDLRTVAFAAKAAEVGFGEGIWVWTPGGTVAAPQPILLAGGDTPLASGGSIAVTAVQDRFQLTESGFVVAQVVVGGDTDALVAVEVSSGLATLLLQEGDALASGLTYDNGDVESDKWAVAADLRLAVSHALGSSATNGAVLAQGDDGVWHEIVRAGDSVNVADFGEPAMLQTAVRIGDAGGTVSYASGRCPTTRYVGYSLVTDDAGTERHASYVAAIAPSCPADFNDDDTVDGEDLAALLAAWGADAPCQDLDGDGVVAGPDLAAVLAAWGPCP